MQADGAYEASTGRWGSERGDHPHSRGSRKCSRRSELTAVHWDIAASNLKMCVCVCMEVGETPQQDHLARWVDVWSARIEFSEAGTATGGSVPPPQRQAAQSACRFCLFIDPPRSVEACVWGVGGDARATCAYVAGLRRGRTRP